MQTGIIIIMSHLIKIVSVTCSHHDVAKKNAHLVSSKNHYIMIYNTRNNRCFSFCSNNMLYPKEDKENKILLYAVST
jgi:hypothetical protein